MMQKLVAVLVCVGIGILLWYKFSVNKPSVTPTPGKTKVSAVAASISRSGVVNCFPKGLMKRKKGKEKPVDCEASAVAYDGTRLIFGSDKAIPGKERSSVFSIPYQGTALSDQQRRYWTDIVFKQAKKLEDFSVSPDGQYVFATTSFDRIRSNGKWDAYNRIFYWQAGKNKPQLFASTTRDPKTGQIPFRTCLAKALANAKFPKQMPYFKVEGLAAIPGQKLLIGVREWGATYKSFQYAVQVLSVSYQKQGDTLVLQNDCRRIYDANEHVRKILKRVVGLSGLEYDRYNKRLYLLTSYEDAPTVKGLGAYLWYLSLADLQANRPPTLVRTPQGKPLHFIHKAEAITVISPELLLVVHDDDRVVGLKPVTNPTTQFYRERHQAAYDFVTWQKK